MTAPKPEVIREMDAWRTRRRNWNVDRSIGFVPTMGALHAGHRSLLARCRRENDVAVASVFVNPTQFDQAGDLSGYPRTFEADLAMLEEEGFDYLLFPASERELYPDAYRYRVVETELSRGLCGAHRSGHFDGMLTVVLKLLQLVRPARAYFGEKDFQQLELVRGMTRAFFLETEVVACPTVREADGLAMSSRNTRLTAEERERATAFPRVLRAAANARAAVEELAALGFRVDYVEDRELGGARRRFGAAHIGKVRLIDNVEL